MMLAARNRFRWKAADGRTNTGKRRYPVILDAGAAASPTVPSGRRLRWPSAAVTESAAAQRQHLSPFLLLAGLAVMFLLSGCAGTRIKQLSGDDFVTKAKAIEQISSFNWTTYVGTTSQRAYLEFGRPSLLYNIIGKGTRTTVYWANLAELPKETADQLRNGRVPWKSWRDKKDSK